jgi:hypothetical protein
MTESESEKCARLRKEIAQKIESIRANIALQELLESEMCLQNVAARHMFFRVLARIQKDDPSIPVLEAQLDAVMEVAEAKLHLRTV